MPFTVDVERQPHHLRFTVAGSASLMNYFELVEQARREFVPGTPQRGLVDLRGVIGRLHLPDQVFIGELVVQKLGFLERLALVVPDDPATYNSPRVAAQKGLAMRGFEREEEALAWLGAP